MLVQEVVPVVEVVREDYLDVLQSRLSGLGILSDLYVIDSSFLFVILVTLMMMIMMMTYHEYTMR